MYDQVCGSRFCYKEYLLKSILQACKPKYVSVLLIMKRLEQSKLVCILKTVFKTSFIALQGECL
jgi:hypothetical protein